MHGQMSRKLTPAPVFESRAVASDACTRPIRNNSCAAPPSLCVCKCNAIRQLISVLANALSLMRWDWDIEGSRDQSSDSGIYCSNW